MPPGPRAHGAGAHHTVTLIAAARPRFPPSRGSGRGSPASISPRRVCASRRWRASACLAGTRAARGVPRSLDAPRACAGPGRRKPGRGHDGLHDVDDRANEQGIDRVAGGLRQQHVEVEVLLPRLRAPARLEEARRALDGIRQARQVPGVGPAGDDVDERLSGPPAPRPHRPGRCPRNAGDRSASSQRGRRAPRHEGSAPLARPDADERGFFQDQEGLPDGAPTHPKLANQLSLGRQAIAGSRRPASGVAHVPDDLLVHGPPGRKTALSPSGALS